MDSTKSLLRTKRYALFWFSSLLSNVGTWMQQVAQPWVLLSLSPSSFWVGFDSFAMNAPAWVFTLWGGLLADRMDRKKIVLWCQSMQSACVLILFLLLILGKIQIWIILLSSVIIGATDALSMPAFQSIIPSLVNDREVPRAIALNSTQFSLSRILGPMLAGVLMASYGAKVCYGANLVSFLPFFISLFLIYPRGGFVPSPTPPTVREFGRLLRERAYQTPLLTVLITSLFCSPLVTFCPVLVKEVFHGGASELGWTMASFGVGGVLGGVISSFLEFPFTESKKYPQLLAMALGGLLALISLAPSLWVLDALLVIAGALLTMSNTASNSNLQRSVRNHLRGRVVSLFQIALHSGISLGSLLTGTTAANLGVRTALQMNGFASMALQCGILYLFRASVNQD